MRFQKLDLNLLVALDALLSEQQVTRAGERLQLSQPAMSGALARLRTHFGDELIVKLGRKMVLTPLAESLHKPVRDTLLLAQAVMEMRPEFQAESSNRHFSVVASDFVDRILLGDVLRALAVSAPTIVVELLDPIGGKMVEDLDRGDVDLLIVPAHYASSEHPMEVLFRDTMTCLVWSEHPTVGAKLTLEQYLDLHHVAMNFGRARLQSLEGDFLQGLGYRRKVAIWSSSFISLPQLVVGTDRIATVPRLLANEVTKSLPLKALDSPIDFPEIVEVMQWHQFRNSDPGVAWLRSTLHAAAGRLNSNRAACSAQTEAALVTS
jgi:LysR family transcriptional regulator, nod-box dependent transcriptional activator